MDAEHQKSSTDTDKNAIYHEMSPIMVIVVRFINVLVILMVLITVILVFVQGHGENSSYFLLIGNLVVSILVCGVVNWWYKKGDLGSEHYWFILVIAVVICFQCITADIFIFKEDATPVPASTTPPPHNYTTRIFPWSTMVTPTTRLP